MKNALNISLGERTSEVTISIDGKIIPGIIDFKTHINSNLMMPTVHIVMWDPKHMMSEDMRKSVEQVIDLLKEMPNVELQLKEIENE